MYLWVIISAIVRVFLVVFLIAACGTFLHRIQHGFTESTDATTYVLAMTIAGTLLYILQTILPV